MQIERFCAEFRQNSYIFETSARSRGAQHGFFHVFQPLSSTATRASAAAFAGRGSLSPAATRRAAIYARDSLAVGFSAAGPAIVEEYGSTTLIGPQDTFEIGALGEVRIAVGAPRRLAETAGSPVDALAESGAMTR